MFLRQANRHAGVHVVVALPFLGSKWTLQSSAITSDRQIFLEDPTQCISYICSKVDLHD